MRALNFNLLGVAESYAQAADAVHHAGECALVARAGRPRQLVMRCPDGCGEILSINLDPRSGRAWRLYQQGSSWSIYPSIDRPSGCLSHFVLWRNRILWCDAAGSDDGTEELALDLEQKILEQFNAGERRHFLELAEILDAVPWDISAACQRLSYRGALSSGVGDQLGFYWRSDAKGPTDAKKQIRKGRRFR